MVGILQLQQIKNDLQQQQDNEDIKKLVNKVNEELQQSEIILQKGEKLQQERENLLAQANASYEKADQAVKLGVKILEEAQQTLSTLQGENLI